MAYFCYLQHYLLFRSDPVFKNCSYVCVRKVQLGPVVREVPDNAIHWINLYSLDSAIQSLILIHWIVIYPVDSAIKPLNNRSLKFQMSKTSFDFSYSQPCEGSSSSTSAFSSRNFSVNQKKKKLKSTDDGSLNVSERFLTSYNASVFFNFSHTEKK